MDVLRNQIIERKVIDLILANAEFEEVPYSPEETDVEALDLTAGGGEARGHPRGQARRRRPLAGRTVRRASRRPRKAIKDFYTLHGFERTATVVGSGRFASFLTVRSIFAPGLPLGLINEHTRFQHVVSRLSAPAAVDPGRSAAGEPHHSPAGRDPRRQRQRIGDEAAVLAEREPPQGHPLLHQFARRQRQRHAGDLRHDADSQLPGGHLLRRAWRPAAGRCCWPAAPRASGSPCPTPRS